jgi:hypothetical protein
MIRYKYFTALLVFLSAILYISCSSTFQEYRIENKDTKLNFLFAIETGTFKDTVREKLIEKYRKIANIYVADNSKLKEIQATDYDVILIMDTCMAGNPSSSAMKKFLKEQTDLSKVVIFITSRSTNLNYKYKDIDAVTAATRSGDTEKAVGDIIQKINSIIKNQI